MADFEICNLKCSIKLRTHVSFQALQDKCKIKSWTCKCYNSYIVIKPGQSLRFIIFKPKYHSSQTHINLTGVRTFLLLESALELLSSFLEVSQKFMNWTLDNISGKSNTLLSGITPTKTINLHSLLKAIKQLDKENNIAARLHSDSYAALILKQRYTTLLVYPSAKIVVIGAKDIDRILDIIDKVSLAGKNVLLA